jgi:RNA polymerase sigma factor (sigma-70 family)
LAVSSRGALGVSSPAGRARPRFGGDDRLVAQVRRGDETAFEIIYERYHRQLLAYCRHILGSAQDAEDALQASFTSAHRALTSDDREIDLRPWLYAIARNACQNIIRRRRPTAPMTETCALRGDPVELAEQREEVGQLFESLGELPELQRSAIVLAEVHGLRHREIGSILGITAEQVKSQVFQARTNLISEREARTADCREIQQELAQAAGAALMRSRLRRHLRTCEDCRTVAKKLGRTNRLGLFAPLAAIFDHWRRALGIRWRASTAAIAKAPHDLAISGSAVELGGGGMAALTVKVLAGLACLGAGTRVATVALGLDRPARSRPAAVSTPPSIAAAGGIAKASRHASITGTLTGSPRTAVGHSAPSGVSPTALAPRSTTLRAVTGAGSTRLGSNAAPRAETPHGPAKEVHGRSEEAPGKTGGPPGSSGEAPGRSGEAPGRSGEAPGRSGEAPGRSGEAPGKTGEARGRSEEPHGASEAAPGKSAEAHGAAAEAPGTARAGTAASPPAAASYSSSQASSSDGGGARSPAAEK